MKLTNRFKKLTYKTLFGYSLGLIALLLVAVPVLANSRAGAEGLTLPFSAEMAGLSANSARPLSRGLNVNHLNPGQENWYVYSRDSFSDPEFGAVSLAMRIESEAQISPEQVNFQVFAQEEESRAWFQPAQAPSQILGFGAASAPPAGQASLIETSWSGRVIDDEHYYVRVFNTSPFGLDYTLEAHPETTAVAGAAPAGIGAASGAAAPLDARQRAWTLTAQAVNNMGATQASGWMQRAQAVGWIVTEGTDSQNIPAPGEANPQTLWRLTAEALEGQDADAAARWLLEADSLGWLTIPLDTLKDPTTDINPESTGGGDDGAGGGDEPPAQPAPPDDVYRPVNIYPNNPLTFDFEQVNSGRLAPYGEHWYELRRDDLDEDLIENLAMTMFFTPIQGYLSNRINFEIFPAGQYHIWQRGDADYMENIGAGMWTSRDEDSHTGERLWSGSLVDGDRYLVKIKNGTPEEVDYYLYPADVENAELGNPILHSPEGGLSGPVPYAASPPTRPGPPPAPGEGLPEAIALEPGTVNGELEAGEEIWYKLFYPGDSDKKTNDVYDFKIYLTNTPLDGIRARHADFAIYPGNQFHIWARGDTAELEPLGTSAPLKNKLWGDEKSLQVVWDGQLMAEHVYYIKVFNHDIGPLAYELELQGGYLVE